MVQAALTLAMLALLLDALSLVQGAWVLIPVLPAGGLLIYWTARLAGMQ